MRRAIGVTAFVLGVILYACLGTILILHARNSDNAVPGLGNFPGTVAQLPGSSESGPFRFVVLGDPEEGPAVYSHLMKKAASLGATFAIIPGDVVDLPTLEGFQYFNSTYRQLGSSKLPTFVAIGNHDITPEGYFESFWGQPEYHFVYRRCLFVFADNNTPDRLPGCEKYLRETIASYRGKVDRVFVIVHKPIINYTKTSLHAYGKMSGYLYRILDTEKVDAVLSAHFHGYLRDTYKDTLILVTGGAGGRLHGDDAFYHAVLVDVKPDGLLDTVLKSDITNRPLDRFWYWLSVTAYPCLFKHTGRLLTLAAIALALPLLGAGLLYRQRLRLVERAGHPRAIRGFRFPWRSRPRLT